MSTPGCVEAMAPSPGGSTAAPASRCHCHRNNWPRNRPSHNSRARRTAMIKGLRISSIWSEDLNNLLPFYRDVLGLKAGLEAPGFAVLGDPNAPAVALGTHSQVR